MTTDDSPQVRPCGEREVGKSCPHCDELLALDAPILGCPACLAPQHAGCWSAAGSACGSYYCSPQTQMAETGKPADIRISLADLERAEAHPPAARAPMRRVAPAPLPARVDAVATAAVTLGGLSLLPIVGLLAGPFGVLCGAVSLGRIDACAELRGKGRALAGILVGGLGLVCNIGLVVYSYRGSSGPGGDSPFLTAEELPEALPAAELEKIRPVIRRALQSNVYIRGATGLQVWIGSGIVVAAQDDVLRILTNRHVAAEGVGLTVRLIDGGQAEARLLWRSDHIDAALLEARIPNAESRVVVARARTRELPGIGGKVFAIGNPHNLTWSYNEGVVSSVRNHKVGDGVVRYIQTQTPINPGNSGGALYDAEGFLVGMNTWKIDQQVGEGLGFAIGIDSLLERRGDLVELAEGAVDAPPGGGEAP